MPYIKQHERILLDDFVPTPGVVQTVGDLNYIITKTMISYLEYHGERYQVYNDLIGVVECAKLELYRRLVGFYEDTKIAENGDVYFEDEEEKT